MSGRPVVILGVTGSIGRQTLEVCRHLDVQVAAIAARRPSPELVDAARSVPDAGVVVTGGSRDEREWLSGELTGRDVQFDSGAMIQAAGVPGRLVVNGVVGAAGLRSTLAALEAGNRLALANKESLVVAGGLVMETLRRGNGELIPVDSEHSALFQLVEGQEPRSLILTASGGPFRGWSREQLDEATPEQALRHPTWTMGRRITIDSATLVNKGLEVIEAHHLFGLDLDRIQVVVHPQSIVHSLVELEDGALLAHIGVTDMRVPIQYALTHPERSRTPAPEFSLAGVSMTFEEPDSKAFPALDLAFDACRAGDAATAAYNAADEVAVEAFLAGRLGFTGISAVIATTLEMLGGGSVSTVEEALDVDARARSVAAGLVAGAC